MVELVGKGSSEGATSSIWGSGPSSAAAILGITMPVTSSKANSDQLYDNEQTNTM